MDHRYIVTSKVRTRRQVPGTSLREIQMIEDLYGEVNTTFDVNQVLAYNNIFSHNIYFPLQNSKIYIKK